MEYKIIIIKVDARENSAVKVQDVLTKFGCAIKVRLGLHDLPSQSCSSTGLIILEVEGDEVANLEKTLSNISGISIKIVII